MPAMFLINILLAALVGYGAGGLVGAGLGVVVLLLLSGAARGLLSPRLRGAGFALVGFGLTAARRVFGLVMAVPVMVLGLVVGAVLLVRGRVAPHVPALPAPDLAPLGARLATFLRSWREPQAIAMTLANLLVLVGIGCIVIGMEVALFVALAAVPLILLALVVVSIDSSAEPEDDFAA